MLTQLEWHIFIIYTLSTEVVNTQGIPPSVCSTVMHVYKHSYNMHRQARDQNEYYARGDCNE